MNVQFKVATVSELELFFSKSFTQKPTPEFSWSVDSLVEEARVGNNLVALEGSGIASVVLYREGVDQFEIFVTFTDLGRRGQGLLTRLLTELTTANPEKPWFLEVHPKNRSAIAAYFRVGFVEVGHRPRYYQDSESALILRKS